MSINRNHQAAINRVKREILLALLIVLGFMCFITILYRLKQPEHIPLELDPAKPSSPEDELLKKALHEPEAILPEPLVPPPPAPLTPPTPPAPEASQALPASGPEMDPATLSPALRRSVGAAESLRTAAFTKPDSVMNRETVESLRDIRRARHQTSQIEAEAELQPQADSQP